LKIALVSGLLANVESVFAIDTTATVYNFEVENTHTYYVGTEGVLVHNSCNSIEALRKIRTGLSDAEWAEFKDLIRRLDPPSSIPTTPIISTAEKLSFYKELAKLDDVNIKAFFNDFKAGDVNFRLGVIKDPRLVNMLKDFKTTNISFMSKIYDNFISFSAKEKSLFSKHFSDAVDDALNNLVINSNKRFQDWLKGVRSPQVKAQQNGLREGPRSWNKTENPITNDDWDLKYEDINADILSQQGYKVEQRGSLTAADRTDGLDVTKRPDYKLTDTNGKSYYFDAATPRPGGNNPRNFWGTNNVGDKLFKKQADRFIVNLGRLTEEEEIQYIKQLRNWGVGVADGTTAIPRQIIIIKKDGSILNHFE
jgi:hypothetical protein